MYNVIYIYLHDIQKERDNSEDLGVDRRIIFKWVLGK
jgi:hypothetical protein